MCQSEIRIIIKKPDVATKSHLPEITVTKLPGKKKFSRTGCRLKSHMCMTCRQYAYLVQCDCKNDTAGFFDNRVASFACLYVF